jgi:hypothetical protein
MTEPLLQEYRAMLEIGIRAIDRLQQQMQFTADIKKNNDNNNNIELDPTSTDIVNTPHADEVCESNIQEALSPFDNLDRIELEALSIQTERNKSEYMSLHTFGRFIQYNQYYVSNAASC